MTEPTRRPVLILGGYGAFGSRAAERLANDPTIPLVVAGRSPDKAQAAAEALARTARAPVTHLALDAARPDLDALGRIAPAVVLNASGPFQAQDYALARAAIAVGAHYVDLADARTFVTGITALDAEARTAGVLVASGASSVPALAAAIVDHHLPAFARLDTIHHGITPGNGYDPGAATTASILGGLGQPIPMLIEGRRETVHGWLDLWRYDFPGLGRRLMANCDVPDIELFPARYPTARTVRFSAGLEVAPFQLGLWSMALLARAGLLRHPERLARPLMWVKERLSVLGSDKGGMFVHLTGSDAAGRPIARRSYLIARHNQGPYVPTLAALALTRKLVAGRSPASGAMPCVGLLTLAEIEAEIGDLAVEISHTTS